MSVGWRSVAWGVVAGLVAVGMTCSAAAQPPPRPAPPESEHGRVLFPWADRDDCPEGADAVALATEAKKLGNEEKFPEAYEKFRCAYKNLKSFNVSANYGIVEVALKKYADGANHLAKALRDWPRDDVKKRDQLAFVEKKFAEAVQHVVALTIEVNLDGAQLKVDGVPIGPSPLGWPYYVDPGRHVVSARIERLPTAESEVTGEAGGTVTVALTIPNALPVGDKASVAPRPAEGAPEADTAGGRGRPFPPAWLALPLGAAAVGIGLGFGMRERASSINHDISNLQDVIWSRSGPGRACDAPTGANATDCGTMSAAYSAFDGNATGSIAGFSIASGAMAIGGAMLIADLLHDDPSERPFHPGLFAVPVVLSTAALAAAAGLDARDLALERGFQNRTQGMYEQVGPELCRNPAVAADCMANFSDDQTRASYAKAGLAMGIIGGVGAVATGAMILGYTLGAKPSGQTEPARAKARPLLLPSIGARGEGLVLSGWW